MNAMIGNTPRWLLLVCLIPGLVSLSCQKTTHKEPLVKKNEPKRTDAKHQNRLINEKSPYLLQHADNPVDWYPWGEEAFQKAVKEDKPIFLSIGYSTCHWCHVMEHESFENEEIAAKINEYFVPIKVDREERPDIDNIYMSAVTAMTGRGGWPLTAILTHDLKPFFGGTYFPPQPKWGSPGLMDILESVHKAWQDNREQLIQSSSALIESLKAKETSSNRGSVTAEQVFNKKILEKCFNQFSQRYDAQYGGFGGAPKFPSSHNLSFLLRYWLRTKDDRVLGMVEDTLTKMAKGGIYDHLGGGFHRYATDRYWQIPHFEKMLYDQAILSRTYLEAYQITKKDSYAQTAREIFNYVLRDMQYPDGGFYSAEDADSLDPDEYAQMTVDQTQPLEKKEGAFFLWRHEEIQKLLGKDAAIFNHYFGVQPGGNAHSDPQEEFTGKNIIFIDQDLKETADKFQLSPEQVSEILERSKQKLLSIRRLRPRPYLDDKILVDWNGLMISSLAFGGKVLDAPQYLKAASQAADFIIEHLIREDGRLLHRYREGESAIPGMIEDYAFFTNGLLDLYEASLDFKYLKLAHQLAGDMVELFWDEAQGGFFFTASDTKELLFRQKELYDGAIPSGNSIAALVLVRLSQLTLQNQWSEKLEQLFMHFAEEITQRPSVYGQMMIALDYAIGPSQEIVIAAQERDGMVEQIHDKIYDYFIPNKVILLRTTDKVEEKEIVALAPFVENQLPLGGDTTVYLCENHVCKLPVKEVDKFEELLRGLNTDR